MSTERKHESYLGLALDHGVSFNRWLATWNFADDARIAVKRALISACADNGLDGMIVGMDLVPVLDAVFRGLTGLSDIDCWLGLPDQTILGHYDEAHRTSLPLSVAPGLWLARETGAMGVKFGISLGQHARWSDATDHLGPLMAQAEKFGLDVMIEPYFRVDSTAQERESFLRAIGEFPALRFTKLDIHDPDTWAHHYSAAAGKWLARSEGLDFTQYTAHLETALREGCLGTMVGAAVWGIKEQPLLGDTFTQELSRRIGLIRQLISRADD